MTLNRAIYMIGLLLATLILASPLKPPQSTLEAAEPAKKWLSPLEFPEGAEKYEPEQWTQSISVLNNRDSIVWVPIVRLENRDWHQSGGMKDITGWKSDKYRLLPKPAKTWIGDISVLNSLGYYQNNRGIKREYADGTRFDDVLSVDGVVFEHRVRKKVEGRWQSEVAYENPKARPKGYNGLEVSCASCHRGKPGTGGYATGLIPGGDETFSDPLDWSLITGRR